MIGHSNWGIDFDFVLDTINSIKQSKKTLKHIKDYINYLIFTSSFFFFKLLWTFLEYSNDWIDLFGIQENYCRNDTR